MTMSLLFFYLSFAAIFVSLGKANGRKLPVSYRTIYVDPSTSGVGSFSTIQSAIDSVPSNNMDWICIFIKAGVYREQVKIPFDKPFIYLKGEGRKVTHIVWDANDSIATSATFTTQADNIVAKSITFTNSYNYPFNTSGHRPMPAVAAMIQGDKSAFYRCRFMGLQDTLWDVQGRHYFKHCTVEGAVDFIFGAGQSIYEGCTVSVNGAALGKLAGFITAQGRSNPSDSNAFVFKDCNVLGTGKAFLGRAWRGFARVVFYNTTFSDVIASEGWSAWETTGHEYQLTFIEYACQGLGADTSKRVVWMKNLSQEHLWWLTSMSFIDSEGWISRQPFNMLA